MSQKKNSNEQNNSSFKQKIVKMCQKNSSNESKIVDTTLEHIPHMDKVGHLIFFMPIKKYFLII